MAKIRESDFKRTKMLRKNSFYLEVLSEILNHIWQKDTR